MKVKWKLFLNKYEKEAFLKALFIYFFSIALLEFTIFYFHYKSLVVDKRYALFLEMKNFSFSFEGEKFELSIEDKKRNTRLYELLEDKKSFYMLIPIPQVRKEVLKISYPKRKFFEDVNKELKKYLPFYIATLIFTFFLSTAFAFYTTRPLRKAIKLLDEAIKDIIHDLNTPLMSIIVNLKLLKLKYPEDEDLKRLELAVNQLSSIYKNLKTAIQETKKIQEEINLKQLIEEEITLLKSLYPDVDVSLKLKDVKIKANKEAVERIIANVLSNAFKHNIPKNGKVIVELTDSYLYVENTSREIKNINKLFDRYYKESQRGIGLGLSIVKKLVNELGWKLNVSFIDGKFRLKIRF